MREDRPWLFWPVAITGAIIGAFIVVWLIVLGINAITYQGAPVLWRDTMGLIQWTLFPGGVPTPFFWVMLGILVAIILIARGHSEYSLGPVVFGWVAGGLIVVLGFTLVIVKGVTHDILASDRYLTTTTFEVADTDTLPDILAKYDRNGTLEIQLENGDLPTSWVPRVASATGALNVMKKTGDAVNNTALMDDTVTYLYGDGQSGEWTAIRNGVNQQDIYGISSWNGSGERVETCRFTGDYALNRAFSAMWGKDLWNSVASSYPTFYYNESDMWGYCDGDEPIIVIPGVHLGFTDMQSVDETAGVLTIQGSRIGTPIVKFYADVEPGEFPGPVYPQRMVNHQREALDWGAGYWQSVNEHFGFDSTSVESQAGNNTNYLMKNEGDGRLYWVTPLKPQSTDSQTLIAYSMIPADEVSSRMLNPQIVYVLNEDDPRVVNLDDLMARVTDAVRDANPGFFTGENPGKIVEFLPVSDTEWQVFAEVQGRVKYRIDVEIGARITTRVVDIDTGETATGLPNSEEGNTGTPTEATGCDDPSSLTDEQLADCLQALVEELNNRSEE
jgi:hypothetical protein